MSILTFFLMLIVAALVIYGITLALKGDWKQLIVVAFILLLSIWVLSAFGIVLPSLPTVR